MTTLRVGLGPVSVDSMPGSPARVPVEVLDSDGSRIAHGTVETSQDCEIQLPGGAKGSVYVRAELPSGERQTKRVDLDESPNPSVQLFNQYVSPHEWLAWSRPHLALERLPGSQGALDDFGSVWTRLWQRRPKTWDLVQIEPLAFESDRYAGQFDLELEQESYLLEIGGTTLPRRFVSLPGGGRVRVLLTPNPSRDPRADPLRVVISRMKADEEMLLGYLLQDRLEEAGVLQNAWGVADRLLYGKYEDPISACIGAYFLLRAGRLGRRVAWAENLHRDMPWLTDGAIILASHLLRSGKPQVERVSRLLDEAMSRGVPVYLEGLNLLNDASQLLASQGFQARHATARRKKVEALVLAAAWSGPMCGFYGRHPDRPNPEQFIGLPKSRKKIDPYAGRLKRSKRKRLEKTLLDRAGELLSALPDALSSGEGALSHSIELPSAGEILGPLLRGRHKAEEATPSGDLFFVVRE